MSKLPPGLTDVGQKLVRAAEHFKTLDREITAFLGSNPYRILPKFEVEKGLHSYRAQAKRDIPILIRILTGELLYHFRSSLDHLAWKLALLNTQTPAESTEFPVFKDVSRYSTRERNRKIGSLPIAAQAIIDGLQPYNSPAPEDDILWVLHRLANDDKHRLPHLIGATPKGFVARDPVGRDTSVEARFGTFDDHTIIGRVQVLGVSYADDEMEVRFDFDLAFPPESAAKGRPVRGELARCGNKVKEVVRQFAHFF